MDDHCSPAQQPPKEGLAAKVRFSAWKQMAFWWRKNALTRQSSSVNISHCRITPLDRPELCLSVGPIHFIPMSYFIMLQHFEKLCLDIS